MCCSTTPRTPWRTRHRHTSPRTAPDARSSTVEAICSWSVPSATRSLKDRWASSLPERRWRSSSVKTRSCSAESSKTGTSANGTSSSWRVEQAEPAAAAHGMLIAVIDDFAKEYLHSELRDIREVMLWKLDGLGEYDVRRPLTSTGTNL